MWCIGTLARYYFIVASCDWSSYLYVIQKRCETWISKDILCKKKKKTQRYDTATIPFKTTAVFKLIDLCSQWAKSTKNHGGGVYF